ncbi:MAG: translation initiation factor [Verrucomicrobiota bacterium]
MSRPKERIPVNASPTGLNAAFSGLQMEGLPEGELVESKAQDGVVAAKPGRVVLRREKAHRGGKTVLVVDGFGVQHTDAQIEDLGKRLRNSCGCGGTVRERVIELQGDQPARVRKCLEAEGFQVAGER